LPCICSGEGERVARLRAGDAEGKKPLRADGLAGGRRGDDPAAAERAAGGRHVGGERRRGPALAALNRQRFVNAVAVREAPDEPQEIEFGYCLRHRRDALIGTAIWALERIGPRREFEVRPALLAGELVLWGSIRSGGAHGEGVEWLRRVAVSIRSSSLLPHPAESAGLVAAPHFF